MSFMRVSNETDGFSTPFIEQSVIVSERAEIMVVAVILKDEDVDPLEVDVVLMKADKVPLRKDPGIVDTMDTVITSSKSAERNLVNLSGHNYLILILLPRVIILRSLHPLFLALS